MFPTTAFPALALGAATLAALTLSGCSASPSTAPASTAPAASAPAAVSAAPTAAEASPSTSAGAGTTEIKDPCTLLSAKQIAAVTGVQVKAGTTTAAGTSKLCSWLPKDATTADAAVFSAQEGPLPGPLSQIDAQLGSEFGGKASRLTVAGADDARYVTGKKSNLNVIDVIAQKGDVFYQVLAASPRDVGQHKAGTIKLAETLLKG